MAWEENSRICLHMQLIAFLSRIGIDNAPYGFITRNCIKQTIQR